MAFRCMKMRGSNRPDEPALLASQALKLERAQARMTADGQIAVRHTAQYAPRGLSAVCRTSPNLLVERPIARPIHLSDEVRCADASHEAPSCSKTLAVRSNTARQQGTVSRFLRYHASKPASLIYRLALQTCDRSLRASPPCHAFIRQETDPPLGQAMGPFYLAPIPI